MHQETLTKLAEICAENKYFRWYMALIESRLVVRPSLFRYNQWRKIRQAYGDTEAHHIVPSSIWDCNGPENLVHLTPREHFIAHVLLAKASGTPNARIRTWAAVNRLVKTKRKNVGMVDRKVTSRMYEILKNELREARRHQVFTEESKRQISDTLKKHYADPEKRRQMSDRNKGTVVRRNVLSDECVSFKKRSLEYFQLVPEEWVPANKGHRWTEEEKKAIGERARGKKRTFTPEWREKLSKSKMGKRTGSENAMADEANRAKVGQSKVGRRIMVLSDGTRKYVYPADYPEYFGFSRQVGVLATATRL